MLRCSVVSGCWLSRDLLFRFQRWPSKILYMEAVSSFETSFRSENYTASHTRRLESSVVMSFMFGGYVLWWLYWWHGGSVSLSVQVRPKFANDQRFLNTTWPNTEIRCNLYSACQQQFVDRKCYFIVLHNVYFSRVHSFRISYVKKKRKTWRFFLRNLWPFVVACGFSYLLLSVPCCTLSLMTAKWCTDNVARCDLLYQDTCLCVKVQFSDKLFDNAVSTRRVCTRVQKCIVSADCAVIWKEIIVAYFMLLFFMQQEEPRKTVICVIYMDPSFFLRFNVFQNVHL
jgi:hypothetical protein